MTGILIDTEDARRKKTWALASGKPQGRDAQGAAGSWRTRSDLSSLGGDEMIRRYRWEESQGRSLGSHQLANRGGKG